MKFFMPSDLDKLSIPEAALLALALFAFVAIATILDHRS